MGLYEHYGLLFTCPTIHVTRWNDGDLLPQRIVYLLENVET